MTTTNVVHNSGIKAIILDYGEVLCLRPSEEQIRRMAGIFDIPVSQFVALYEKNRLAYDRGDLTPERYWFSYADEPGIRLDAVQIPTLRAWDVEMWSCINPVMVEWVASIHQSGTRTALLSNMHADMVAKVRRDFGWIQHFDCLVFSQEVRLAKPEATIYEHCLRALGTTPHETLFIDDREVNVRAAERIGIRAIRFGSVEQLRGELEDMGYPLLPSTSVSASV